MGKPNKYFLIGLATILILALILPQIVQAGLIPGPFDYFESVAGKVEEVSSPIMSRVITVFIFYALGMAALAGTAHILDKVIFAQSNWLTLSGNGMVEAGWSFTVGLANMLMILILIFIAIQFILKIETFQTKKALVSLLIVALLLNFSLLFIEIALDITDVLYNSILSSVQQMPASGEPSLAGGIADTLIGGKAKVVRDFTIMIGGWAASALIPGGAIRQYIIAITFIAMYLPLILGWMIQTVLFFLVSGMFATFILLFAARVYIIQFFAILAPLAFLALILPQTKKYWDMWLKHLLEWILLGIFFLFFLALGSAGIGYLMPTELYQSQNAWLGAIPFVSWKGITSQMAFYFFEFIYLLVILIIGWKTMPALASQIISYTQAAGSLIWTKGLKPIGKATWKESGEAAAEQRKKEEAAKREGREPSRGLKAGRIMERPTRFFYRVAGTTPEREAAKNLESKEADYEKRFGKDVESAKDASPPWRVLDPRTKAAFALYAAKAKGAEGLKTLNDNQLQEAARQVATSSPDRLVDIIKHKPKLIEAEKIGETIQNALVPKGKEDKDAKELTKELMKDGYSEAEAMAGAIKKAAFKKAADALKKEDIETLSDETFENENFKEALVRFKPWNFLRSLGEEKGRDYLGKLQNKVENLGVEKVKRTNPTFIRAPYTPGGRLLMRPWKKRRGGEKKEGQL